MKFNIYRYYNMIYIGIIGDGPTLLGVGNKGLWKISSVFYSISSNSLDIDENGKVKINGIDMVDLV